MPTSYDRLPVIHVDTDATVCREGLNEVRTSLIEAITNLRSVTLDPSPSGSEGSREERFRVVIECYPGVLTEPLIHALREGLPNARFFDGAEVYRDSKTLREQFAESLGDDPVFGYMRNWDIDAYFQQDLVALMRRQIEEFDGIAVVIGTGASRLVTDRDLLIYLSSTRWILQGRQRAHLIGNPGFDNAEDSPSVLYKNAFFLDWRVGDALRHQLYQDVDWFVDVDDPEIPKMIAGDRLRSAVKEAVHRPFRVVPFFDPGPWGGQWMRQKFGLPEDAPNYAWAFDCVPEENSVLLAFGNRTFSLPAQVLVSEEPEALLGESVYRTFGAEFPIRFDYLDTMGGGNLSLQVHPLRAYIREHFGMKYTQDESYYILDCEPGSHMYLGLREGVQHDGFAEALREANAGLGDLDAGRWVNQIPTHKHDHFSIPAGTVHCSGRDNVVLEISATPYIFTFKLWDWGRMGLDGRPRPVHLAHGLANVQWDRDTGWVNDNLRRPVTTVGEGDGWREEKTGLHELEFLETRRHWFTKPVAHDTHGNVHVLNLVEGDAVVVESPDNSFPAMYVHYGETFIVPAAVGRYSIRPLNEEAKPLATMKAYVRTNNLEGNR
jgi:mannose-6-phosphate isomerase class I